MPSLTRIQPVDLEMSFEAIVDDARDGHPIITIAHHELKYTMEPNL